jgi:pimeloyl-ACP methyl ester carboxylesterase
VCASPRIPMTTTARFPESDVRVAGGRLRLRDHGGDGRLVLCIPGLSANATSFDFLGQRLVADHHRHVVSLDLRGRGFSEITPAGTYGWPAHARDVLDVIRLLGGPADVVGHSMGAYVAMAAAGAGPGEVRRLVLIDGLGPPDRAALPPILAGLERLGAVHQSAEAYLARVRAIGVVDPWSEYWDRYYTYDLEPTDGGVRSRTDRDAVLEDARWGADHDARELWPAITQPTLLVRALRPMGDGGFIVSEADRDAFLERMPNARAVEIDANHYTVVADEATAMQLGAFLDEADVAAITG